MKIFEIIFVDSKNNERKTKIFGINKDAVINNFYKYFHGFCLVNIKEVGEYDFNSIEKQN